MSATELVHTVAEIRARVAAWRAEGRSVAFVPTMGNLHDGHLSLARLAGEVADVVVMSIFVNPTQFGAGEDFEAYPRTVEEDRSRVDAGAPVDLLFVPTVHEIYPRGTNQAFSVRVPALGEELCGASRPGHFDGVASVVLRLLHVVSPDTLVLGRKDYQQFVIVRSMVEDLHLPVDVRAGPTSRHPDGLAMSSRNGYLREEERARAPTLHRVLVLARDRLARGERGFGRIESDATDALAEVGFRPDYVEIRRSGDLARPTEADGAEELMVLGAAWLGATRLIDNVG